MEVAELLRIFEIGLGLDQLGAGVGVVDIGEFIGEFDGAGRKDGEVEGGDAPQAPGGVDDGLDESGFFGVGRVVFLLEARDEGFVGGRWSVGRRTVWPVSPVLRAFLLEACLPRWVRGPVLSWALAWLAESLASEIGLGVGIAADGVAAAASAASVGSAGAVGVFA